ncbi:MAG: FeoA family protein [Clostridia bacterium]|nr:FeoA family protein [Clostridia bacterium]
MGKAYLTLNKLPQGKCACVKTLFADEEVKRRLEDLGLVTGTKVEAVQKSRSGDPTAYYFRGTVIALRSEQARQILVEV